MMNWWSFCMNLTNLDSESEKFFYSLVHEILGVGKKGSVSLMMGDILQYIKENKVDFTEWRKQRSSVFNVEL